MKQYDVCRLPDGSLVVIVQADAIQIHDTKTVIPLVTPDDDAGVVQRLTPLLTAAGEARLLATHLVSVVRRRDLSQPIGSLDTQRLTIQLALDLLFNGS